MRKLIWLLLAAIALAGCSVNNGPDEVALYYKAGPIEETKFEQCVDRGSRTYVGVSDLTYQYPAGQRNFEFTGAEPTEEDPEKRGEIEALTRDGVTVKVLGSATFALNVDCEVLQEWHERIGKKYSAHETGGWVKFLKFYLGGPLEKAVDQATKAFTWRELASDVTIREDWEAEIGRLARIYARDLAGGDYLCDPAFTGDGDCGDFVLQIQEPKLPEEITQALTETAAELERKNQATNAQERINVEAESLQALVNVLGPEAAVLYQAMKDGLIQVMPVPTGSTFLVNPPQVTQE